MSYSWRAACSQVDNAFLPEHDMATPREVYSRSIVYLNDVSAGGAPIIVWPRAHKAAADVVQQLISEDGHDAYHGVRWRDEVVAAMTLPRMPSDKPAGYDTRQVSWPGVGPATEVLMQVRARLRIPLFHWRTRPRR